ncbi:UNVERIFIED_CONTAM: hypothetical protein Sangu_3232800 [Sesamum angustifolium]|uniref:Uncharacterized protein n=1 Tax=Sesamum angustifolium TaxID=2727405 RepID=A0AAW2JIB9_9LAMI
MANSNNDGVHESYEGDFSILAASRHVPPADPTLGDALVPTPAPGQVPGPVLRQFIIETINSTICGSQASRAGLSSQVKRGGIPGN